MKVVNNVQEKNLLSTVQVEFEHSNEKISDHEHQISLTFNVGIFSPFEFLAQKTQPHANVFLFSRIHKPLAS